MSLEEQSISEATLWIWGRVVSCTQWFGAYSGLCAQGSLLAVHAYGAGD